ncbi:hypothetical protein D9M71_809900 [compost metagenome]
MPLFWLKRSTMPSLSRRLATFFGGSSRSNSSTTPMRIRSLMRTSTGRVQQVAWQSRHRSLVYLAQVSRRSTSASATSIFFMAVFAVELWKGAQS